MTLNIAKYRKHSKHTDEIKKYLELVQKALTEYASEGLIEEIKQINQNLIDKVSDETY